MKKKSLAWAWKLLPIFYVALILLAVIELFVFELPYAILTCIPFVILVVVQLLVFHRSKKWGRAKMVVSAVISVIKFICVILLVGTLDLFYNFPSALVSRDYAYAIWIILYLLIAVAMPLFEITISYRLMKGPKQRVNWGE